MILSAAQLRRAANIQEKIEELQQELASMLSGSGSAPTKGKRGPKPKNAGAAEAGAADAAEKPAKRKSGISAAGRKRIAAAQKARWAKAKAESDSGDKKASK